MVNRVTYTGDLGYEIWVAPEYQRRLYAEIIAAGREFGIVNFGMRALLTLRLEKNFPTWYRELRPIYGPYEADVERFVDLAKGDFIGREAAMIEKEEGGALRRRHHGGRCRRCRRAWAMSRSGMTARSSAGSPRAATPIGPTSRWRMGYVPRALMHEDDGFAIEIIGSRRPARPQRTPLFDPEGARMRG